MNSTRLLALVRLLRALTFIVMTALLLSLGRADRAYSQTTLAGSPTPAVDTITQEQLITQVLQRNNRLAASQYMARAAHEKIGPSGAWDDPMLMVGIQNIPSNWSLTDEGMTMKMVGLSWNIPYSGQKGLSRKAAGADAESAGADRDDLALQLVAAAQTAYADLYYRKQAQTALSAQYELMDQLVASIRGKLATNQASQEELLSAQTELWRLQSDLLMSEADVDRIQYDLNALRGSNIDVVVQPLFPPDLDSIPMTADRWIADARQNLPQLRKLQAQSSSYQYAASAAHRMKWPMLNLSGSYGFRTGSDIDMRTGQDMPRKNMITILGTVSLPLFSGRSQSGMARNMEGMKSGTDAEYAQAVRETEARVRTLHLSALHGLQSIGLYRNSIIPASEDAYASGLTGYKANRTSLTAVLNLALAIYRNKLALYQLQFQLAETMAQINRYTAPASRYLPDPRTEENH